MPLLLIWVVCNVSDFSCIFPLQKGCPTTSLFFLPDVGGSVFYSRKLTEALGKEPSLYGFRLDPEFDWSQPERTFIKLAEQFADNLINSDIPEPYHLIGHSFAGLLAFETARQLKIKGGNVGLVALLDTPVPEHMRINSKIEKLTYVLRMIANIAYWVWHKILSEGLLQTVKFFIGKQLSLYGRMEWKIPISLKKRPIASPLLVMQQLI